MSGPDPQPQNQRGRWVAILTGAISVLIGVAYLLLITLLDSRGPLLPPPPEALGLGGSAAATTMTLAGPVAVADGSSSGVAAVPPPG